MNGEIATNDECTIEASRREIEKSPLQETGVLQKRHPRTSAANSKIDIHSVPAIDRALSWRLVSDDAMRFSANRAITRLFDR
jgi:hypothetical protein